MEAISGKLTLKAGRSRPVLRRHPWIFSGAIAAVEGRPQDGDLVAVHDQRGDFLAIAYFNSRSDIRARVLTTVDRPIDDAFWAERIGLAVARRQRLQLEAASNACRLIFAESDGLPGLIVDRYADTLVMQPLTLGIERRKRKLAGLLADLLQPAAIVDRADASVRAKEGLGTAVDMLLGAPPPLLQIEENGLTFNVDALHGHKTGFYLDQRDNRRIVCEPRLVEGKAVLNLFSYSGGFGVYAAANGAAHVTNVDSSVDVLQQAEENFRLNDIDPEQHDFIAADAFELLRYYRDQGQQFDVIICDPPKFAAGRRDVDRAARGYKDLNWLAFRLLRAQGVLATFSCSAAIDADLLQKIIFGAVSDAGRNAQIVRRLDQAADHPTALHFPESSYLKGLLCLVD